MVSAVQRSYADSFQLHKNFRGGRHDREKKAPVRFQENKRVNSLFVKSCRGDIHFRIGGIFSPQEIRARVSPGPVFCYLAEG